MTDMSMGSGAKGTEREIDSRTGIRRRTAAVLSALAIAYWLAFLQDTDAVYFVYVLVGAAGAVCLFDDVRTGRKPESASDRRAYTAAAVLFGLSVLIANLRIFELSAASHAGMEKLSALYLFISAALVLAGGSVIAYHVILCVFSRLDESKDGCAAPLDAQRAAPGRLCGRRHEYWLFAAFAAILGADLFYLFTHALPASLTTDSLQQLGEIISGIYTDHHPFWHTQLIRLAVTASGDLQRGITLFAVMQCVLTALAAVYGLSAMRDMGVPAGVLRITAAAHVLLPYHFVFASTIWKDVPYAAAMLVCCASLLRILGLCGLRAAAKDRLLFAAGAAGVCLLRSNGRIVFALFVLTCLFIVLFRRGASAMRRVLACSVLILAVTAVLDGPVLRLMHVGSPDILESVAVPGQQIARLCREGAALTEEDEILISRLGGRESIGAAYDERIFDPVKAVVRANDGAAVIEADAGAFLKLWAREGMRHPYLYLRAFVDETKGYWNAGYGYWVWPEGMPDNQLGISAPSRPRFLDMFWYCCFWPFRQVRFFLPLFAIGLYFWILCLAVLRAAVRDRLLLPVVLLPFFNILTLLAAAPVFSEFRYAYSMPLCLPLLVSAAVSAVSLPRDRK